MAAVSGVAASTVRHHRSVESGIGSRVRVPFARSHGAPTRSVSRLARWGTCGLLARGHRVTLAVVLRLEGVFFKGSYCPSVEFLFTATFISQIVQREKFLPGTWKLFYSISNAELTFTSVAHVCRRHEFASVPGAVAPLTEIRSLADAAESPVVPGAWLPSRPWSCLSGQSCSPTSPAGRPRPSHISACAQSLPRTPLWFCGPVAVLLAPRALSLS